MAITQHKYIRIEAAKFGSKGLVYVGCILLAAVLTCIMAGALGPELLSVQSGDTEELEVNKYGQTKLSLDVDGFNSLNQFYWINVQFTPKVDSKYEQINSVDITLNVTGDGPLALFSGDRRIVHNKAFSRDVSCSAGSCDGFFLFGQRQIFFGTLKIDMEFSDPDSTFVEGHKMLVAVDVVTISPEYTKFEMIWKDIFMIATLFILFTKGYGYLWKIIEVPFRLWSSEQTWVLALLLGLVAFNDPFFFLQIFTKYALQFSDLYIILTATFICGLLLFWLCSFDELRLDEGGARDGGSPYATRRNMINFFGPKCALMISIWSVLVWLYTHLNSKRDEDPTYDGLNDDVLWNGEIALMALILAYSLYLFGLIVLNVDKIRAFSPPFKFIFVLTMITVVFTLVALGSGYFFPFYVPAMIFVLFYAIINLYIWAIAFSYCPFRESDSFKYQPGPSSAFGEDYFDDVAPPSMESRERIAHDNQPLIEDSEKGNSSNNDTQIEKEIGFRQRLSFGNSASDVRVNEKLNNKLELASLGSRSNSLRSDTGAAAASESTSQPKEEQPKARPTTRLADFQQIEFS
jgi:hypothetical protein